MLAGAVFRLRLPEHFVAKLPEGQGVERSAAMGLPFFDPDAEPPAWFLRAYQQAGLLKSFSEP